MRIIKFGFIFGLALLVNAPAGAHFGMLIPSDSMIMQSDQRTINLTLSFSHPMEMVGMDMAKPSVFKVMAPGGTQDLLAQLKPTKVMDRPAWLSAIEMKRPGVYTFFMEPQPYWEPAEDCYIIHLTKSVVAAFGDEENWDAEIGLKTEIVPLTRPFGLIAGNLFQGIVKLDGRAVPYALVEVEYYNQDKKARPANDYMVTQSVKADGNGVFSYCAPVAGWWGFAALSASDQKIKHEGQDKDVELGAVLWVQFQPWQAAR